MLQKGIVPLDIIYQKVLLIIIPSSSMEKTFYDEPINSDIKRYK